MDTENQRGEGGSQGSAAGRSWPRRLLFGLGLLLVVFIGIELLSALTLVALVRSGRLPLSASASASATPDEAERQRSLEPWRVWDDPVFHPYVGYTWDPSGGNNALGYPGRTDTLVDRAPNTLFVVVTGGSVAQQMFTGFKDQLADRLAASERYAGRDVRIACLALPGYKQPQQLYAVSWMLTLGIQPDIVINLDGFNEVANGLNNEAYEAGLMHPGFPAPEPWLHLAASSAQLKDLERAGEVSLLRHWRGLLGDWAERWSLSPTVRLVHRLADRAIEGRIVAVHEVIYGRMLSPDRDLSPTQSGPVALPAANGDLYERLTGIWERSSRQMHALAQDQGFRYLHFLQPNQYVPGSKVLSPWEQDHVVDTSGRFPPHVVAGYPYLFAGGERLRESGVSFHDLTRIFQDETEGTYIDTCCHLGPEGNVILVDAIADVVIGE